jgi:hypothetical protein
MFVEFAAACVAGGAFEDVSGAMDGRKHSAGDFVSGFFNGCLGGLLWMAGAGEEEAALEGSDLAAGGADGAEQTATLGDDLSGEGTGADGGGQDACTTTPNSFTAGTPVELADGSTEPISEVRPGDKVLATNPATGKTSAEPVLAVITGHKSEHLVKLTISTGTGRSRRAGVITATTGHPIWDVTQHGWVSAGSLHTGDRLYTVGHSPATVAAIASYSQNAATVYNLTVATDHTYYVGGVSESVLVHNCTMPGSGGAQFTSQTFYNQDGMRLDAENPVPGRGPGNIHLHIGHDKYYYNFQSGKFEGLSNRLATRVYKNAKLVSALQSALHLLGM